MTIEPIGSAAEQPVAHLGRMTQLHGTGMYTDIVAGQPPPALNHSTKGMVLFHHPRGRGDDATPQPPKCGAALKRLRIISHPLSLPLSTLRALTHHGLKIKDIIGFRIQDTPCRMEATLDVLSGVQRTIIDALQSSSCQNLLAINLKLIN